MNNACESQKPIWGFLRETQLQADKLNAEGPDKDTGLFRTGLDTYLARIFPKQGGWIHDKPFLDSKFRPDYRNENLHLIVEFDGIPHYKFISKIQDDEKANEFYRRHGYDVVRIPFFIQLSRKAIKTLFHVDVGEELFDERIPSFGKHFTPANLSAAGFERMVKEFRRFPEQYRVNLAILEEMGDEVVSGAEMLKHLYDAEKENL